MRTKLIDIYASLKEAGSASRFPLVLGNTLRKLLLKGFESVDQNWRKITSIGTLADFKTHQRNMLHGLADLQKIVKAGKRVGTYNEQTVQEDGYNITLDTDGTVISIPREVIINDDQNAFAQIPQFLGDASARAIPKTVVKALTSASYTTFDGKVLFHVDHANYLDVALANTPAGANAVDLAITKINLATDPKTGQRIGLRAKYLVVPQTLEGVGKQLLSQVEFSQGTGGGSTMNIAGGRLELVVLPDLDGISTTGWYVIAEPSLYPVIEVGFLNGQQTPDLMIKKPEMMLIGSGDDPYSYEFDELTYKSRFDYAVALGYYQGIVRGKA